ncbi:MAG: pyrimidine dimer DNA glycosylase/endonuclease V [Candidatus Nanohaloarchaea archaeon]|nr:pyrimidine dimer DNA glycosylase/endonuclease V [Candidatus Nanohaloarchaea archaeon]
MRVWDIAPKKLCDQHLLGEHSEIHAIWSILTEEKQSYRDHPEVRRWEGKLKALHRRHQRTLEEMKDRGFSHESSLDRSLATGDEKQNELIDSLEEQRKILNEKNCKCDL